MKLVEVMDGQSVDAGLKCLNCGGKLKHRTRKYDGYIVSNRGERQDCWLSVDDYECESCKKIYREEEE